MKGEKKIEGEIRYLNQSPGMAFFFLRWWRTRTLKKINTFLFIFKFCFLLPLRPKLWNPICSESLFTFFRDSIDSWMGKITHTAGPSSFHDLQWLVHFRLAHCCPYGIFPIFVCVTFCASCRKTDGLRVHTACYSSINCFFSSPSRCRASDLVSFSVTVWSARSFKFIFFRKVR